MSDDDSSGPERVQPASLGPVFDRFVDECFDSGGVFVTTRPGVESFSVQHARSGYSVAQTELLWRCLDCAEMGELRQHLPDTRPKSGVERDQLLYWMGSMAVRDGRRHTPSR